MMDVNAAVKKPFSDWGKLILGSIIGLIPIVNFTMVGYGLQNAKTPNKLPEFSFDSFVLGLKAIVVGVVYGLLTLLVMTPFAYGTIATLVASAISGNLGPAFWTSVAGTVFIVLILAILLLPLNISAMLILGRTEKISAALNIQQVAKYAYRMVVVKPLLIAILIGFLLSIVLSIIPILGTIVAGYAVPVFTWSYLGANAPKK